MIRKHYKAQWLVTWRLLALLALASVRCIAAQQQQQYTCRLQLEGDPTTKNGAIAVAVLDCSPAVGGTRLPVGLNSTYITPQQAAQFQGVDIVPNLHCQQAAQALPSAAQSLSALLYFCSNHSILFERFNVKYVHLDTERTIQSSSSAVILFGGNVQATIAYGRIESNQVNSALALIDSASVAVQHSLLVQNTGRQGPAALARGSSYISFLNCTVSENTAWRGAAVYLHQSASMHADIVTFSSNRGCVYAEGAATVSIRDAIIRRTTETAAIRLAGAAQSSIDSSTIFQNTVEATGGYGAVFNLADTSGAAVTRSTISNNTAALGGAVFLTNFASISISDSIVEGNRALPDANTGGGAILAYEFAEVTLSNSSFVRNAAFFGGAICLEGATKLTADNGSSFLNNIASQAGGGVLAGNRAAVLIRAASTFTQNTAQFGAAVAARGAADVSITDGSSLVGNQASARGGGLSAADHARVLLDGASISGNSAGTRGGGVYMSGRSAINMSGEGLIFGNSAVWGGGVCLGSSHILYHKQLGSALGHNNATYGADFALSATSLVILGGPVVNDFASGAGSSQSVLPVQLNISGLHGLPSEGSVVQAQLILSHNSSQILGVNRSDSSGIVHLSLPLRQPPGQVLITFSLLPSEVQDAAAVVAPVNLTVNIRGCVQGEVAASPNTCKVCLPGTYSFTPASAACEGCPSNAECPGGAVLTPKPGYWHSSPYTSQIHRCYNPLACMGDRSAVTDCGNSTSCRSDTAYYANLQCSGGYTGNMCASCSAGHGAVRPFNCSGCMPAGAIIAQFVVATVLLLCFIKYVCHVTVAEPALPDAPGSLQVPMALGSSHCANSGDAVPGRTDTANGGGTGATSGRTVTSGNGLRGSALGGRPGVVSGHRDSSNAALLRSELLKPLVLYMQYLLIVAGLGINWPGVLQYPFMVLGWLWAPASPITMSLVCVLPHSSSIPVAVQQVLVYLFMPLIMLVGSTAVDLVVLLVRGYRGTLAASLLQRTISSAIVVAYFFLPSVLRGAFGMFACIYVDNAAEASRTPAAIGSFWVYDSNQACLAGYHKAWAAGLGLPMLLLACGAVPSFIVWKARTHQEELSDSSVLQKYGFLFRSYKRSCCWWDALLVWQTAVLVIISAFAFTVGPYAQGLIFNTALALISITLMLVRPYANPCARRIMLQALCCVFVTCAAGMSMVVYDGTNALVFCSVIGASTLVTNLAFIAWVLYKLARLTHCLQVATVALKAHAVPDVSYPVLGHRELEPLGVDSLLPVLPRAHDTTDSAWMSDGGEQVQGERGERDVGEKNVGQLSFLQTKLPPSEM